jgi:hypothetical protein
MTHDFFDPVPHFHGCQRQWNLGRVPVQSAHAPGIDTRGTSAGGFLFQQKHPLFALNQIQSGGAPLQTGTDDDDIICAGFGYQAAVVSKIWSHNH